MRKDRKELKIPVEEIRMLEKIRNSRKEKKARVERAGYILDYIKGSSIYSMAKKYRTNRPKIQRVIHKAYMYGVKSALEDLPGRGRKPIIDKNAKMWILNLACQKPNDLGLPEETWSMSSLAKYVRIHCEDAGFPFLKKISKGTVWNILARSNIKPHKVKYYLKRTDPQFEEKMYQILHVYKEVEIWKKEGKKEEVVVSYDEKPGIQAIGNVHEDLLPKTSGNSTILRDAHYKRYGTISLLSGIDLLTGEITAIVKDRHRSEEFIQFLKKLDEKYPEGRKIKIILDNHSSHISKKTKEFLKKKAERFEFIFTPKHGSWLNIIESFFSKLTRCLLKTIRVSSKEELRKRILQYIEEVNTQPVIFRWRYKLNDL